MAGTGQSSGGPQDVVFGILAGMRRGDNDRLLEEVRAYLLSKPEVSRLVARRPRRPVVKGRVWNEEKVVAGIRRRAKKGEPLNSSVVCREDNRLFQAAGRYFGGWPQAIKAAGLEVQPQKKRSKGS